MSTGQSREYKQLDHEFQIPMINRQLYPIYLCPQCSLNITSHSQERWLLLEWWYHKNPKFNSRSTIWSVLGKLLELTIYSKEITEYVNVLPDTEM